MFLYSLHPAVHGLRQRAVIHPLQDQETSGARLVLAACGRPFRPALVAKEGLGPSTWSLGEHFTGWWPRCS